MRLKKSWIVPLLILCLAVVFVVLAGVGFAPAILSTEWGKKQLLSSLNKQIPAEVKAQSISLHWFGPQVVSGVEISDPVTSGIFTCDTLSTDAPLWDLLFGNYDLSGTALKPYLPNDLSLPTLGHLKIEGGKMQISELIKLQDIHLDLSVPRNGKAISLALSGKSEQSAVQGIFDLQGNIGADLSFQARLNHFPLQSVDQILSFFNPQLKGEILDLFGPSIELDLKAGATSQNLEFALNADADRFHAHVEAASQNQILSLKNPAAVSLTVTPASFQRLAGLKGLALLQNGQISLQILQGSLPFTEKGADVSKLGFQAALSASPLQFSVQGAAKPLQFSGTAATANTPSLSEGIVFKGSTAVGGGTLLADGNLKNLNSANLQGTFHFQTVQFPLSIVDQALGENGKLVQWLGPMLSADLTGTAESGNVTARLKADTASLKVAEASFQWKEGKWILMAPASIGFSPNVAVPKIAPVSIALQSMSIPSDLSKIQLEADIKTAKVDFSPALSFADLVCKATVDTFDKIHVDLQSSTLNASLDASVKKNQTLALNAQITDLKNNSGTFNIAASIDQPLSPKAVLEMTAEIQNFSTKVLETWMGKPGQLTAAIGPVINGKAQIQSYANEQKISATLASQFLNMDVAFVLKDGAIQLQNRNQAAARLTVTQSGYALIDQWLSNGGAPLFQLSQPAILTLTLSDLNWPVATSQKSTELLDRVPNLTPSFPDLKLQGDFHLDKLSLVEKKSGQTFELSDLKMEWSKQSPNEPVTFQLNGKALQGSLVVNGSLDRLFSDKGTIDFTNLSSKFDLNAQQFPVVFLDLAARVAGKTNTPFSALLGDKVNATATAQIQAMSGPVTLNINAPNSRASLIGHLNQGVLILNEPIYAQLNLTPEVSALLLKEVNPLSIKSMSAKNPLTLEIEAPGFSVPLYPFDPAKVFIPKGRIELGQIICQNEGNINIALGILKSTQLGKEKQLNLWFAPIDFQVDRGIVNCERTEILIADTFDVAVWGKIDTVKDYVDMILGLTAPCLKKAFGIKNLPEDYVIQIPMKGKSDNVQINTGKATAKIALLLAWQQKNLAGSLGGPAGAIFGEFLNSLGTLPDMNAKAPPAKHPYPWEENTPPPKKKSKKQTSQTEKADKYKRKKPSGRKKAIKRGDKPLKQIYKIFR